MVFIELSNPTILSQICHTNPSQKSESSGSEDYIFNLLFVQEKEDKALLQAEVQNLRQNNQRLQEESQSTVARLIKVTELLCNVNKPC